MNTSTISTSSSTDSFSELIQGLENNEIHISNNRGICQRLYDWINSFFTKDKTD